MGAQTHDRLNNFDGIRLLGAMLVLVGHAYPLHGLDFAPVMWNATFSTLGIMIFFSLSGYLIATSWHRDARVFSYLQKRALRIFPGLAVVTLGSIFVLGPVLSSLSVRQYFTDPTLWQYLSNIILWPSYALPGLFQNVPYVGTVNGSLWSLPIEFACYLLVPLISLTSLRFRPYVYAGLALAFAVTSQLLTASGLDFIAWGSSLAQATAVWPFFMMGAAVASAGNRLPIRLDFAIFGIILGSLASGIQPSIAAYVWIVALPYAIIAIGSSRTPIVSRLGRFGDVSYGIYLYSFPVQQAVISVLPNLSFQLSIALTTVVTYILAFASWHLIEKQALKFKPARRASSSAPLLASGPSDQ